MKRKLLSLSMNEVKLSVDDNDEWRLTGYATIFNNPNVYGFMIAPGAYKGVLESGVKPKMFFNHSKFGVPIGVWDSLEETEEGLLVSGTLTKGVRLASDVHAALKAQTVDGLSVAIGWEDEDEVVASSGIVILNTIRKLYEISVVTYPADEKARISEALSADEIDEQIDQIVTLRDFETFTRNAMGLSKRQSGWLLSKAKAAFASETRRDAGTKELDALAAIFDRVKSGLD